MGIFGDILLNGLGQAGGQYFGGDEGRRIGGAIGSAIGGSSLVPFKKGGRVRSKRPLPALLHPNEFVLPASVKPTKKQIEAVKKLHKKK